MSAPGGVLNATPTPITGNNNQVMGGWYAYTKNSRDEYTLKQAATTQYDAGVSIRNGKANIQAWVLPMPTPSSW